MLYVIPVCVCVDKLELAVRDKLDDPLIIVLVRLCACSHALTCIAFEGEKGRL